MARRNAGGTKTVTKSYKVPVEHDDMVESYISNAAAQLGITKGEALVHVILIQKEYGNLPAIVAGGFMNMQRTLTEIREFSELAAYGNDLGAIEEARQIKIGSDPDDMDNAPASLDDLYDEFNIDLIGGDDGELTVEERASLVDMDLRDLSAARRLKRGFPKRRKKQA